VDDVFGYKDKKVVLLGAFSGIGEQAGKMLSDSGAELYAVDIREPQYKVKKYVQVDLISKASVDAAAAQMPDKIDALMTCAGVAGEQYKGHKFSNLDVITINFISSRRFIKTLIPKMVENSAIVSVASIVAFAWQAHLDKLLPFVKIDSFEEAQEWISKHFDELVPAFEQPGAQPGYCISKAFTIAWMTNIAYSLAKKKIRFNTLSPGGTSTAMSDDFNTLAGMDLSKSEYVSPIGRFALPEEQAYIMLFLDSKWANYISGADIRADYAAVNQFLCPE
jgi:NAD(P)-dependent dehydrogenase (short-subunit alcohol dehydrogenase family)